MKHMNDQIHLLKVGGWGVISAHGDLTQLHSKNCHIVLNIYVYVWGCFSVPSELVAVCI